VRHSSTMEKPLAGRTIAFLEARRSDELGRMVEHQGGSAYIAPALREVPVTEDTEIRRWLDALVAGRFDVVLFLTGVGCRTLLDCAQVYGQLDAVLAALGQTRVVARGPKPVHVLKQHSVRIDFVPPEPNTSDELVAEFRLWDLAGKTVGVQLYGGPTPFLDRLRSGLGALGARIDEVTPYRWEGPSDEEPVRALIAACLEAHIDALAIFSSSQVTNLFAIAEEHDQAHTLRDALNRPDVLIAAVGPVSAEALLSHGVKVDLQPEHPKMGHLVTALAQTLGPKRA
jgi:uroporphyrinogen-III synthase